MASNRPYFVHIVASRSRRLYTGVTNHLERRVFEHRQGISSRFTRRYRIYRLVHYEIFGEIRAAIAREKQIKAWRREKRIALIEERNPTWADLADASIALSTQKQIPHPKLQGSG